MSAEAEIKSAAVTTQVESFSGIRWSRKKIFVFIVFVFAVQLGLIFSFGTKKNTVPRSLETAPHFQLANDSAGLIALSDPTLFAQPHIQDFTPAIWRRMPDVKEPANHQSEAPPFLAPETNWFGARFNSFMASHQLGQLPLNFKPAPLLSVPEVQVESMLPQLSTVRLEGEISMRPLREPVTVPSQLKNDVIEPSRVQLLVDSDGHVVSVVVLNSSGDNKADQDALDLARRARFVPATGLALGEMIFDWHTVPTNAP